MHKLERFSVKGFRRLISIDVELRPLTVVIGANGAGKTSFLDAFSLLSQSASGTLNKSVSNHGGLGSILTRGIADELLLQVSTPEAQFPVIRYLLKIKPEGNAYVIPEEALWQQGAPTHIAGHEQFHRFPIKSHFGDVQYWDSGRGITRPNWQHDPFETSLAQVPKLFHMQEEFRRQLASHSYYAAANFDTGRRSRVRLPQTMRPVALPSPSGEDLVACLYSLRESDHERFEAIQDTIGAAFPDFERFDFPPVAAGTLALTWKDRTFSKPFYMNELSEGTLRFLWLATLLQSPGLTDMALIDEPEVSLHPDMLRILVDLLRETSRRTPLIVATQSERLIRFLEPAEVLVCDLNEGQTQLRWADTLDLDQWLADYAMDELWRLGRIGGRP